MMYKCVLVAVSSLLSALVISGSTQAVETRKTLFTVKENHRKTRGVFVRLSEEKSLISCGHICSQNSRCVATNFRSGGEGGGVCELLDSLPSGLSEVLVYDEDWVFTYSLKDDCRFRPCSNGGTCFHDNKHSRFGCYCTALWTGDRCHILQARAAVFHFTTLGSRGRHGPTSNATYKGTVLENTAVLNGTHIWTVPVTGNYHVTACGAAGADGKDGTKRGKGALVNGTVFLHRNHILEIMIGQQGDTRGAGHVGSGGGGTFIVNSFENNVLAVAGGGGGGGLNHDGGHGYASESCIGKGGEVCAAGGITSAGGGGAYRNDGMCYSHSLCTNKVCKQGGKAFSRGGEGGESQSLYSNCDGGFGGGGACGGSPGGGGGFSGGDVSFNVRNRTITASGGGGCCRAPSGWNITAGYNDGDGYATFVLMP